MARCLIIEGEKRGLALAGALRDQGHAVRASARDASARAALAELGVEVVAGDPDRVATLARAMEHVAVAYVLLGHVDGPPEAVQALHTTRLDMLLSKMLDSTVRGIVYEAAGTADEAALAGGAERVRAFCEDSRIPFVLLSESGQAWLEEAVGAVDAVLAAR